MRLAGDRLVKNCYEAIAIMELSDGGLEGYSEVLDLNLCWEEGQLLWHDPETDAAIMSLAEMQGIMEAEHQAKIERTARLEAERISEERNRQLKEKLGLSLS